ncbi:MAG: CopG family transcriptional regulator [archaeon]|nr:CopG family transcriptional regulator [archaeon]
MSSLPKKKKKEKITLRMDEDLAEILERVAEREKSMNKSQIIREGLQLWINLRINKLFYPDSDLCMFSLNMLRKAFNSMNSHELFELSRLAFKNSQKSHEGMQDFFGDMDINQKLGNFKNSVENMIELLISTVYGPTGYRWFDSIEYKKLENKIIVLGIHRLGNNFSQFFMYHLSNNMELFSFEMENMSVSYELRGDGSQTNHVKIEYEKKNINNEL